MVKILRLVFYKPSRLRLTILIDIIAYEELKAMRDVRLAALEAEKAQCY